MCGIAGILSLTGAPIDPALLRRMIGMVKYRGPDDGGIFLNDEVGLAHARLSIIDLETGRQPMATANGSAWITFNGEIFNYLELRRALEDQGCRFATRSDTEVILQSYERDGARCVDAFNGQWAFALWDQRRRRLFLSRDRFGTRPLFYTQAGGAFLFASEVKSLFAHPAVKRELDLDGLDEIFTYWTTLAPRTAFKGVHELPPGHSLLVEDGRIEVWPYWQLDYGSDDDGRSETAYAEELLALLTDAVRLRLRADLPVGVYLSGGLDSSVVASLVQRSAASPVRTFSVAFEQPEFDEEPYQNEVSRFLGTDHSVIRCSYSDIGRVFPEVVWHAEKPLLRTAPAPLFLLSQLVRDSGYKVVLTGEGSDEVIGGYDIFKEAKIRRFWGADPASNLRPLLLQRLYPYLSALQGQTGAYLRAFFGAGLEELDNPFFSHLPRWRLTAGLKLLFSRDVRAELAHSEGFSALLSKLPKDYRRWEPFCQAQYLETTQLLPGYILSSQGDRVAMAHAVEGRFPFLDYRLVEFAARIPPALKMRGLNEKYILKRAARELVPEPVRRRRKQPYRAPDAASLFAPPPAARHEYVNELLSPARIKEFGIFDPGAVEKLAAKARSGGVVGARDNMAIVGVLSTQLLVSQFVANFGI